MRSKVWHVFQLYYKHQAAIRAILAPGDFMLGKLENNLLRENVSLTYPPIFIVGPPRTGSTLLYQVMTRRFKMCYFSNFMMAFPSFTFGMAKIAALFDGCRPPHSFSSAYGRTYGWSAPSQGFRFWNLWFPNFQDYLNAESLSEDVKYRVRSTIAMIQRVFEAPFLNKWQRNAVRLLPLANIFPEALFIRIKRKPEYVARSLLAAKKSLLQDESRWFSTRPSNFEHIRDKHPKEQVCEQVCSIERDIDRNGAIIGMRRFITVHYEELVHSPHRVMNDIKKFYDGNHRDNILEVRDEIPSSFPDANNKWEADPELVAIASYLSRIRQE